MPSPTALFASLALGAVLLPAACATQEVAEIQVAPTPAEPAALELYRVRIGDKRGFIDGSGALVIPAMFDSAGSFHEGLARVEVGVVQTGRSFDHSDSTWGFIDETGAFVAEPVFDYAGDMHEGRASVRVDRRYGFIDATGELVLPAIWSGRVGEFSDGRASVDLGRDRLGYLDLDGQLVISLHDVDNGDPGTFSDGRVRVSRTDDTTAYLDRDGELVFELGEDSFGREFREGLAAVRVGKAWGFVDTSGAFVIEPQLEFAWGFYEGLAVVWSAGVEGPYFIDREGHAPFDCSAYDELSVFSEGLAMVRSRATGKHGYVDRAGALVIDAVWDDPEWSASSFRGGVAAVGRRVVLGNGNTRLERLFIDRTGRVLFDPARDG
jgi:hypothetical protein